MSSANDQLGLGYPLTLTLRGKVYNHDTAMEAFAPVMKGMVPYANNLMRILLTLRLEKYTLDGIHHTKEEVEKDLRGLMKEYGINLSFAKFSEMAGEVYRVFVCYVDAKGKLKVNGKARGFANVFFSEDDATIPENCPSMELLRKKGMFPILVDGKPISSISREKTPLKYSVAQDVLTKLTSMEEISKEYEKAKTDWENECQKVISQLPLIGRYEALLTTIPLIPEMRGFDGDNYRKMLNRWRDYVNEDGELVRGGMKTYFLDLLSKDTSHKFNEEERYLFGYCPEFMNLIYHDFRDLWSKEDIIGSQRKGKGLKGKDYVDVIFNCFHWRRESINISSFGNNDKVMNIHLGDNFVPFELKSQNGIWEVHVQNLHGQNDPHRVIVCRCPQFNEDSSMKMVHPLAKNGEESDKENIEFRYSGDSKRETWYTGLLKEPTLRYDVERKSLYVDFILSNHRVEGVVTNEYLKDPRDLFGVRGYFLSSSVSNPRQKDKTSLPDGKFNVMGVDLGLKCPYECAIYGITVKNGKMQHKWSHNVSAEDNNNVSERLANLKKIDEKILATQVLISLTKMCVVKDEEIPDSYTLREHRVDIAKSLDLDMDKYRRYVEKCKKNPDKIQALKDIRKSENNWIVAEKINEIRSLISEIRSEYYASKDKRNYCRNLNGVDLSVFLKKKVVKNWISLLRSFSTFGMTPQESAYIRKDFAKNLSKWYKGLVRKCGSIAAHIVNIARDNKVMVIFIEDLDARTSAFDSKEDNELKILWGWGEIKKWIGHQARKHNIAVVAVDPHLTSLVNHESGLLGIAGSGNDRNIYTFQKNKKYVVINRDNNAAHNIALRGLSKHTDIREFYVEQIDVDHYRLMYGPEAENGKRRSGAIYKHIGSTECVFSKQKNGTLKVEKTSLTKDEKEMPKINGKGVYAILHGNEWRLRHELNEELGAKLDGISVKRVVSEPNKVKTSLVKGSVRA